MAAGWSEGHGVLIVMGGLIRTSNPDLPDVSDPIKDGCYALRAPLQSYTPGAEKSWPTRASTHPKGRCRPACPSAASERYSIQDKRHPPPGRSRQSTQPDSGLPNNGPKRRNKCAAAFPDSRKNATSRPANG